MNVRSVRIDDIIVENRIREELGDIEEMASSMSRVGQLQPIIITDQNLLVAGGRRLEAAKLLGWEEIHAVLRDEVDEATLREIELEENLKRKDLTWVEEVRGLRALWSLKQDKYGRISRSRVNAIQDEGVTSGGASQSEMARELGRHEGQVSIDLALARALEEYPDIAEEKTKAAALKRYKIRRETALRTEQAKRTENPGASASKSFDAWSAEKQAEGEQVPYQPIKKVAWKGHGILYLADSRDVLRIYAERNPSSIDCIVTDPPFALGMHKEGQTIGGSRLAENVGEMYDDDPHLVIDMLDQVFGYAAQMLKPDGHAYVFFHMTKYEPIYLMLKKHFGECEPTPIIWIKNTPGVGDPNRTWVYGYEPCFFVNRGRSLIKAQAFNYLKYDTIPHQSKIHPTEKPAALLRHLISASTVPGEVILDPFAGSGSTLVAANQLGCKFIGVEQMESFHRRATERLSEAIEAHASAKGEQAPRAEEDAGRPKPEQETV